MTHPQLRDILKSKAPSETSRPSIQSVADNAQNTVELMHNIDSIGKVACKNQGGALNAPFEDVAVIKLQCLTKPSAKKPVGRKVLDLAKTSRWNKGAIHTNGRQRQDEQYGK